MRILYINNSMMLGGGVEKCILQLSKYFSTRHEVFVASAGGEYVKELDKSGIKHFSIINPENKNPLIVLKNLTKIYKMLKENKIDIVHSNHRMTTLYLKILRFLTDVPVIHTSHLYTEDKKILTHLVLKGIPIISVSNGVKKGLIEKYHIKENNINVIYNAIELNDKKGTVDNNFLDAINKEDFIVGVISRLESVKGIELLLDAAKEILSDKRDVKFFIIGKGSLENKFSEMIKKSRMENSVFLLGGKDNIKDYLCKFDVLVQSSYREGLPLAVIEAISLGIPVIGTDIPGTNEVIINNYNGLLVEVGNTEEIKGSILYLYKDRTLLKKMSVNGIEHFENYFRKETYIENHLKSYQSVIENNH